MPSRQHSRASTGRRSCKEAGSVLSKPNSWSGRAFYAVGAGATVSSLAEPEVTNGMGKYYP
jgi:hypothetical protein